MGQKIAKADAAAGIASRAGGKNLDPAVQFFIVQQLACFRRVSQVRAAIRETFGLELSESTVRHYDPTKFKGWELSVELKELFYRTRELWSREIGDIGVFDLKYRGERLDHLYHHYEDVGNGKMALKVLEHASKEVGKAFTNKQEISGVNGGPLAIETRPKWDLSKLSEAELEALKEMGLKCTASGD